MKIGDIEIKWLGHAGFLIKNSKVIYIDPYNIKGNSEKADLILLTHSHYDHCSFADLNKIIKEGTKIIMTADCQSKITRFDVPIRMEIVEQGQELNYGDVKISVKTLEVITVQVSRNIGEGVLIRVKLIIRVVGIGAYPTRPAVRNLKIVPPITTAPPPPNPLGVHFHL